MTKTSYKHHPTVVHSVKQQISAISCTDLWKNAASHFKLNI